MIDLYLRFWIICCSGPHCFGIATMTEFGEGKTAKYLKLTIFNMHDL